MAQPPRIVFAGAATMDLIFRVDRLPTGPGKVLPSALVEGAHGMASSAAASAARLGGRSMLIARVGDDETGARFVADLEREGVDCRFVRRSPGVRTALCADIIDAAGERIVVPYYDPALGADASWLPLDEIAGADAVLVDVRWPQGAATVLDTARQAGIPAVIDADVGPVPVIEDLVSRATHAVFSEPAALSVSGSASVPEAVRVLAARFDAFIAVTAGPDGCYWMEDGEIRHRAAPRVVAVDTLAAGDVFHGAFVLALAEGMPMQDVVDFANAAAALKCTVFGGRLGAPRREDVLAMLEREKLGN
jgi:sugar/nucleoside kinase (ribokinase family)